MANTLHINPEYYQHEQDWTTARDLYEGDHAVLTGTKYLWTHAIEEHEKDKTSQKIRARRCQRTRYLNLAEVLVSLWCSLFFKQEPKLDPALEKLLNEYGAIKNIDGRGRSLSSFFKNQILPSYLLYGKVILSVDALPIVARNKREEIQIGQRPFIDIIQPLNFVDWSRETTDPKRMMQFKFARHEFMGVMPRETSNQEPRVRRFSYEYRKEAGAVNLYVSHVDLDAGYRVIDDHWDAEKKTENWQTTSEPITLKNLENIPLSVIEDESWLKDANEEMLRYFNLRSNRDNINYNQGFDEKYLKLQGGKITGDRLQMFNEYTHRIIATDEDAFKIPPIDPSAIERAEAEAIRNIFRVGLNRLHSLPDNSAESPSAESQDKSNEYTSKLVESALGDIEDIANEAFKHFAAFTGNTKFEGKLQLDKEISDESFEQFITTWQVFGDRLSRVEEIAREVDKKALHKLKLPKDRLAELERALESAEVNPRAGAQDNNDPIENILNGGRQAKAEDNEADQS